MWNQAWKFRNREKHFNWAFKRCDWLKRYFYKETWEVNIGTGVNQVKGGCCGENSSGASRKDVSADRKIGRIGRVF